MRNEMLLGHTIAAGLSRHRETREPFRRSANSLTTHGFICGSSGFGKTVLGKCIVEEAALSGVPGIVIDLKGDLSSLAIPVTDVLQSDGDDDAVRQLLGRQFAKQRKIAADTWKGDEQFRAEATKYARNVDVRVFTPKSEMGRPLALTAFPKAHRKLEDCNCEEREAYEELAKAFVTSFLSRIHGGKRPARFDVESALLRALVDYAWRNGELEDGIAGLQQFSRWILDPPIVQVGGLCIDDYMPLNERRKLAAKAAALTVAPEDRWYQGTPLDIASLIASDGRTPVTVINLSHITDFHEQAFVVAQVCFAIYRWMRQVGGSEEPRLLLYCDEIGGGGGREAFYPAHPYSPPSKGPLSILVKQGRAFGVGCLLATQNSLDVDHKGLSNCRTWYLGKLPSDNEKRRISGALQVASPTRLAASINALRPAEFLMVDNHEGAHETFRERILYSAHHTISPSQLPDLVRYLDSRSADATPIHPLDADTHGVESADMASLERPSLDPFASDLALGEPAAVSCEAIDERLDLPSLPESADDFTEESVELTLTEGDPSVTESGASQDWILEMQAGQGSWALKSDRQYTLGRHPGCDIVIEDRRVSRRHMLIAVDASGVSLMSDQSVKNPARVDGTPLTQGESMHRGEGELELLLGETTLKLSRAADLG